ncbi:MAG TPA: hypothetical protein VHO48_10200 [Anaerolineaceae bacterium]|nr:hypothetical protein [Anaerolineaceae bacterium]
MFNLPGEPPPDAREPADTRFSDVHVEPWPDGRRVRVHLTLTPYKVRPNLEATIVNREGDEVAAITIVENLDPRLVITMHIREPQPLGPYTLTARILYEQDGTVDEQSVSFSLPEAPSEPD